MAIESSVFKSISLASKKLVSGYLPKISRWTFLIYGLLSYSSVSLAQQYQDGNVYQHWRIPVSAWNLDTYIWPSLVSNQNFFAQTFQFQSLPSEGPGSSGGYIGIIQDDGSNDRIARFSIWNANAASGSNCRNFSGEGVGKTCAIPYDFQTSRWYKLRVWKLNADQDGQWWGGWIIDTIGNETHIGNIRVPPGSGDITGSSSFNEYFGPAAACNTLPSSVAFFYLPILNDGQARGTMTDSTVARCSDGAVTPLPSNGYSRLSLGD